ncbi:hypothetical protein HOC35_01625 [Candidatus Woesearchaeota archaeon]|jgi:hypothetical protein|nr:hypothetical protein [Candidatus Woesearchaeota archaeon]
MNRRSFLQSLLAVPLALSTPKVVDKGLELIASADASEKAPISETEFERLVGYDTVDQVLDEYGIGSVDDSSYQRKVYDSDKHVMVVFYNNRALGSKGLSVLAGLFSQEFGSNFDNYAYKLSESDSTPNDLTIKMFKEHGIKKTPAIVIYKNSDLPDVTERVISGISTHQNLNKMFTLVAKYINSSII